ncbi:MAG: phenylalanine--tRNA ligase subunit beta, partial [Burkholderiales bacterium]|nr:phenylalanine--tRNA ligase subunit beta [Burkholderiales bacterium]
MKFSENWLRTFVNPALSSAALADALTMAGLEVESREPVAPAFEGVVVGQVLEVEKHPRADRLHVCRVDVGSAESMQIVCGAANVAPGIKAPVALVGARLPEFAISRTSVRGVESSGMLCSAKELGLAGDSNGLLLLPEDAPVGADFRSYDELDDRIFTLKLTPNRADCLSLTGVARDVAAITATSLYLAHGAVVAPQIADALQVETEVNACPRYCGRVVRGIDMHAPTPAWMSRRLDRSGIRGINAVVDVTNYVMLELGQPLHAFDLAHIDRGIAVRYAGAGEKLALLNGQTLSLAPDMLVIADMSKPLALAGIMGGADSAVSDTTVDVFLESAFFDPQVIAGRTRRLGFSTESAHRFERGVDFAATGAALERATQLLIDNCGGQPGPLSGVSGKLPHRDPIRLRAGRVERVLGVPFPARKISPLLRRLHLSYVEHDGEFHVTPHSYRFDLEREEDLIEEIARIHGYDQLPANKPNSELSMLPAPEAVRSVDALKAILVAREYHEIVSYSFVDR